MRKILRRQLALGDHTANARIDLACLLGDVANSPHESPPFFRESVDRLCRSLIDSADRPFARLSGGGSGCHGDGCADRQIRPRTCLSSDLRSDFTGPARGALPSGLFSTSRIHSERGACRRCTRRDAHPRLRLLFGRVDQIGRSMSGAVPTALPLATIRESRYANGSADASGEPSDGASAAPGPDFGSVWCHGLTL